MSALSAAPSSGPVGGLRLVGRGWAGNPPAPPSVTPIARTASATGRPCAVSTSTCRSLATISSAVCLFLAILASSVWPKPYLREDHFSGGRPQLAELVPAWSLAP